MLLTLTPPSETKLKLQNPHAHSPPPRLDSALPLSNPSLASIASLQLPQRGDEMSHQHRGLPPPAGMSLPDPMRGHSNIQSSYNQIQSLPAAPSQWQGAEESTQSWLYAKAEEDKKRQEEERTKQEELRLSQRRIEADMLRESISGGVPPHLVPIIFAGLGGPALASAGLELAQHHLASAVQSAQHHQYYLPSQQQQPPQIQQGSQTAPGQPAPPPQSQSSSNVYPSSAYHQSPRAKNVYGAPGGPPFSQPTSGPRLARLTTGEHQIQGTQESQEPSPSIYFHHWQPPSQQSAGSAKDVAKDSSAKTSPPSGTAPSHLSESMAGTSSPRKRKAQGEHKPAPPPSGGPPGSAASPSFSVASTVSSSKGRKPGPHGRNESGESSRGYDPIRSSRQPERRESSSRGTDSASKPSSSRQQSPQPTSAPPQ